MSGHAEVDGSAIAFEEILLEPIDDEQLGHAEKQQIGTQSFRKCTISTTIYDLRRCYFFDSTLSKQREACICFFQIEFGSQKQDSRQRISDISIEVAFSESDEDVSDQTPYVDDDSELSCKDIYPLAARGASDVSLISRRVAADLRPTYMDASLGGVTIDKTKKYEKKAMMEFRASPDGDMGYRLQLTENAISKSGVPPVLRFAVLLQTDGIPFTIELSFVGNVPSFLRTKLGGQLSLKIEKKHLWLRLKDDEGTVPCQDTDSRAFVEWVKTKTRNSWAETDEYEV